MPEPLRFSLLLDPTVDNTPEAQDPHASIAGSSASAAMTTPGAIRARECRGVSAGVTEKRDKTIAVVAGRCSLLWAPTGKVPTSSARYNLRQSVLPTISATTKAAAAATWYRHTTAA